MSLPPELIDMIVCNLAPDILSLRRCSLIAKSWTYPSRKWLFKNVVISARTHQLWLDRISPGNVELLRNVRFLAYIFNKRAWDRIMPSLCRIDSLSYYLPSFHHLEKLELSCMLLGPKVPQQIGLFSAFQHTLSALSLCGCRATSNALIAIVNYFPLLIDLHLWRLTRERDGKPVLRLSRPLRGRLAITDCETEDRGLFNKLSDPPPELDELTLCRVYAPTFYNAILGAHGGSVKCLEMSKCDIRGKGTFPNLSHCRELRELLVMVSPSVLTEDQVSLITSITSTNLQKIVLSAQYGFKRKGNPAFESYYQTLDGCLCQLVERLRGLGYEHRLDVVIRISEFPDDKRVFEEFLPRFREQGRVKLVRERNGKVVYCSD